VTGAMIDSAITKLNNPFIYFYPFLDLSFSEVYADWRGMPSVPKLLLHLPIGLLIKVKSTFLHGWMAMAEPVLVITNFPDKKSAVAMAEALIDQQLAACVNVLSPCTSVYRWQGNVESADEIPVLIKTRRRHYERVEQLIKMMHPYELPEVIMVPITDGLPAYLQWIANETPLFD
jgi:periplasmic divalent cation tolerance protein